jgi:three-Cys-motif partner protein
MPVIDLHEDAFGSSTITKLEIFQEYLEAWLPVWAKTPGYREVAIFDFFAGPGTDIDGALGSPLRILETINKYRAFFAESQLKANVHLNELDSDKFQSLRSFVDENISRLSLRAFVNPIFYNEKFEDLFPRVKNIIGAIPTLLFIDQNGVKQIPPAVFRELCQFSKTDFLFFISSAYFKRFADDPSFSSILPTLDKNLLKAAKPYSVHSLLVEAYKKMIPSDCDMKLHQFTLRKDKNYYGLVFGAKHPLAVDKYLEIAWRKNSTTGDADFDLEEVAGIAQGNLFDGFKRTKLEQFAIDLEDYVLQQGETTNKEIYDYCSEKGFRGSHGKEVLLRLKKEGKVSYESKQPCITYGKCYRENVTIQIQKTGRT